MLLICLLFNLLALASTSFAVAVRPVRQITTNGTISSEVSTEVTATVTTTITEIPPTITIAVEDSSSVQSSLSSAASVDTEQVSQESQLAPVSDLPFNTTPTFVHSIVVPAFEATELSGTGTSVYYVSVGPNTTNWSFTPTGRITVGLTTVTVKPIPLSSVQETTTTSNSSEVTATLHANFSTPAFGWNDTTTKSSLIDGATGSGISYYSSSSVDTCLESTVSTKNATITTSTNLASNSEDSPVHPHRGDGALWWQDPPFDDTVNDIPRNLAPRQTCTLISAYINWNWATWCNNWDGSTTLTYTEWETTVTPGGTPAVTTTPSSTSSTTSVISSVASAATPAATPALCGQSGPFEIGFDDLPQFSPADNDTADFPPIFNPFDHFWWGDGWAYVPPPTEPFPPQNGTHLAEFIPSLANTDIGSPDAGLIPNSSFGAGPRNYNNVYWFDAYSAWVGCDNGATDPSIQCDFVATGYQWDPDTEQEKVVTTQHFPQPPCPNFKNCELRQIIFDSQFTALTTLSFYANLQGDLRIFWIDSIDLDWYNNTCAAGLARASSRKA